VVKALCLNITEEKTGVRKISIPGTHTIESKKLFKIVSDQFDRESKGTQKVVILKEVENKTTLYGQEEETFITHAVALDPATRKPIEVPQETTEQ
jgi:hypothetical protein